MPRLSSLPIFSGGFPQTANKAKDDIMGLVKEKLESLGYFPVYITPDVEQRISDLQYEELSARKNKQYSIEKGVRMSKFSARDNFCLSRN